MGNSTSSYKSLFFLGKGIKEKENEKKLLYANI